MKKVMSIIAVALFTATFVACGPSAEEKAKMEERAKQVTDSIANAISASMAAPTEKQLLLILLLLQLLLLLLLKQDTKNLCLVS